MAECDFCKRLPSGWYDVRVVLRAEGADPQERIMCPGCAKKQMPGLVKLTF